MANAEWGCRDGDHRAWVIVDVDSKEEARAIVPPLYRSKANIIGLNHFTPQDLDAMLGTHGG